MIMHCHHKITIITSIQQLPINTTAKTRLKRKKFNAQVSMKVEENTNTNNIRTELVASLTLFVVTTTGREQNTNANDNTNDANTYAFIRLFICEF
jgi:hypothetical protein